MNVSIEIWTLPNPSPWFHYEWFAIDGDAGRPERREDGRPQAADPAVVGSGMSATMMGARFSAGLKARRFRYSAASTTRPGGPVLVERKAVG